VGKDAFTGDEGYEECGESDEWCECVGDGTEALAGECDINRCFNASRITLSNLQKCDQRSKKKKKEKTHGSRKYISWKVKNVNQNIMKTIAKNQPANPQRIARRLLRCQHQIDRPRRSSSAFQTGPSTCPNLPIPLACHVRRRLHARRSVCVPSALSIGCELVGKQC